MSAAAAFRSILLYKVLCILARCPQSQRSQNCATSKKSFFLASHDRPTNLLKTIPILLECFSRTLVILSQPSETKLCSSLLTTLRSVLLNTSRLINCPNKGQLNTSTHLSQTQRCGQRLRNGHWLLWQAVLGLRRHC